MSAPTHRSSSPAAASTVVLGSGSRYRRELLARLLPAFDVVVPRVDETQQPGEPAAGLAERLARLKAETVAAIRPDAVVIGSDQVAECEGEVLGKPGSSERAIAQLQRCAGRRLTLHTAVCVIGPGGGGTAVHVDRTRLSFRPLTTGEIVHYVSRDEPYDCAGSFKFESLGAALFSDVETRDPTAIQGLPLLWLAQALTDFGIRIL